MSFSTAMVPARIIVIHFEEERYLLPRKILAVPYTEALAALQVALPQLAGNISSHLSIRAPAYGEKDSKATAIVPITLWEDLLKEVEALFISIRTAVITPPRRMYNIYCKRLTSSCTFAMSVCDDTTVSSIKEYILSREGIPVEHQQLICSGELLEDGRILADYHIEPESNIMMVIRLRGGKPIIYLYPPRQQEVSINLKLGSSWEFSAIYPETKLGEYSGGSEVTWTVLAAPDGTLSSKDGRRFPYLFWEADTVVKSSSPSEFKMEPFDPLSVKFSPKDSVKLARADIAPYLHSVLPTLSLHNEAVTSFITYWLPKFLQHKSIALRFIKQTDYEPSAMLSITPTPDVVTRVFMVFTGLDEARSIQWTDEGNFNWSEIIGIDGKAMTDTGNFRVLEWGGMEVR